MRETTVSDVMSLKMKLKTVIVEDELHGQKALTSILNNYCSDSIEIVGLTATVEDSIQVIKQHNPDLVFLDIRLGLNADGAFDILRAFDKINFKVVFTTSSRQTENILQALNKYGAKKYLLKPLDIDEVVDSVSLVQEELRLKSIGDNVAEMKNLLSAIGIKDTITKVRIPVRNGIQYVPADNIIMFRSDANCTVVFLIDRTSIRTSRNLKYFEEYCSEDGFFRTSRSYIINLKHVERYTNRDGGTIHLCCDCTAALSDKYTKGFFEVLDR